MQVQILKEEGINLALRGLAYSYHDRAVPADAWWAPTQYDKALKRAKILASKDGGHNKFLESIVANPNQPAHVVFTSETL